MIELLKQYIGNWGYKPSEKGSVKLVVIQPTTFCNLDCDYCYLPDRQLKYKLSLELIEPIFRNIFASDLIDSRGFTIVWHAGEPLTVPISFYTAAIQIVDKLNQEINTTPYQIEHSLQTNATMLTQDWCDFIKEYDLRIGVSIDGPDFIHDAHRKTRTGKGTHASTMRGIKLLQNNQIPFSVIAVLSDISLNYPDEIFDFFLENNIRYVGFNIEEIEGTNRSSSLQNNGVDERYRNFMQRFYGRVKEAETLLQVREFDDLYSLICQKYSFQGQFTPFTMINIAHNGDFSTFSPELLSMKSDVYGDFILGNITRHDLRSIDQTDKFKTLDRDIQAGVKMCQKTCPYFSLCGGGAPANKYYENGTFRSAETMYCRYTKKIIADIILEDLEKQLGIV